jgi:hypothetical protein
LRRRFEQYGPDGVHPKRRQARCGRPPAIPVQTERRVIAVALAWPTCGPQWYSDQLAREGVRIAPTTVWRLLRRRQLGTRKTRLAVLEHGSAATTGILTERTAKALRHVEAAAPGELLSLDTFYVGKLKGVGKVWQITGCDVASSFAWARLIWGGHGGHVLGFLRDVVRPAIGRRAGACARADRQLGKNSTGRLPRAYAWHSVTRTKPATWTNGFVGGSENLASTGASRFGGSTSPAGAPCRARTSGFCSSTTTSGRTVAIASAGARRPPSFVGPWLPERVDGSVNTITKLDRLVPQF